MVPEFNILTEAKWVNLIFNKFVVVLYNVNTDMAEQLTDKNEQRKRFPFALRMQHNVSQTVSKQMSHFNAE